MIECKECGRECKGEVVTDLSTGHKFCSESCRKLWHILYDEPKQTRYQKSRRITRDEDPQRLTRTYLEIEEDG